MIAGESLAGVGLLSSAAAAAAHAPPPPAALKLPTAAPLNSDRPPPTTDWVRRLWGFDGGSSGGGGGGDERRISGITVPRQKYISSSKAQVLEGLVSLFDSPEQVEEFTKLSACLDSIIHAERKRILEELRLDYFLLNSPEPTSDSSGNYEEEMARIQKSLSQDEVCCSENKEQIGFDVNGHDFQMPFQNGFNLGSLFISQFLSNEVYTTPNSRVTVAARFQRAFMELLHDAQFEELSVEDLMLTSALNTNYLLTLPIYVDWEKAYESNAIIFRRGYSTERQRGLLIGEKLDYLQSKLLQSLFFGLSIPFKKAASWINQAVKGSRQMDEMQKSFEKIKHWLQRSFPPSLGSFENSRLRNLSQSDSELPIWLAAQRAIPVYEGFLSSQGPRERLWRRFLTAIGFMPSMPDASLEIENEYRLLDPQLRPNRLPRISIGDLWAPAWSEVCGNNPWKKFRNALSILFSPSTLEEPAFQELILLYSEKMTQQAPEHYDGGSSLQLKIYEKIPIPDLPVVFPHKKLSFRILDIVRLDISSILGLLAFIVNYKFEDILSSPSALLLDVIAISALILYVSRVVLGYKQTWDRYQLLVNKTLYEKTLASGFGSVHFLLDASEQQEYKEAILAYGLMLQLGEYEVASRENIKVACERFLYEKLREKVEMPIDKAMDTLLRLGLVKEMITEEDMTLQAFSCAKACEALRRHWDNLLGQLTG